MRRIWSLPILLIGVTITLLVVSYVAFAAGNASRDSKKNDFLYRVADALGLPFADVKSAHDQAKRELEDNRLFESRSLKMFKEFSDGSIPFAFPHSDYDMEHNFDGGERSRLRIFPNHGKLDDFDEFFHKFHSPDSGEYVPH